jgi:peptidoglycan L-alanyl-D-glutamate endopeptidase CwlK
MSAGATSAYPGEPPLVVHNELGLLAPRMKERVLLTIEDCHRDGLDAIPYETYREHRTAVAYYARGRTQIPPRTIVTNAPNELYGWHGYGLACDIISASKEWSVGYSWFEHMARIAKSHGLKWGGDWTHPDLPHIQWGPCKASPSDEARRLFKGGGLLAVWRAVGAAP